MKKNKGISLIVLVITIIVMIILAGTIILTLNSNSIIGRAKEAVLKNEVKVISEAISLKQMEDYENFNIDNISKGTYDISTASTKLKDVLVTDLGTSYDSGEYKILDMIKLEDYGVSSTTKGHSKTEDDIYIINVETGNIYYVKEPYSFSLNKIVVESVENKIPIVEDLGGLLAGEKIEVLTTLEDGTFYFIKVSSSGQKTLQYYDGNSFIETKSPDGKAYTELVGVSNNKRVYVKDTSNVTYLIENNISYKMEGIPEGIISEYKINNNIYISVDLWRTFPC